MKHFFFTFFVVISLLTTHFAFSQISVGFRGGVNLANAYFKNSALETETNEGITFGIPIEIPVSRYISVQSEINWLSKGYQFQYVLNVYVPTYNHTFEHTVQQKTRYNYIDVPFLLKAKVGSDVFKLNALIGPGIGYAIRGSDFYKRTRANPDGTTTVLVSEKTAFAEMAKKMDRLDLNLNAGGGISLHGTRTSLFLEARYQLGLNSFVESNQISWKHRGLQIFAGLMFRLKDK